MLRINLSSCALTHHSLISITGFYCHVCAFSNILQIQKCIPKAKASTDTYGPYQTLSPTTSLYHWDFICS